MLGPPKSRCLDQPIAVLLEELVPSGNFYCHLEAKLDLSFVRAWARELYAERGRPSIDPVVFFKLQLVMFFEGICSERQLIETASLNLAHRWYLGYALEEVLPDHSTLTRIRQRLGIGIFERFFEKVVDLCQEAGLVWERELYFDGTKVEANADFASLVPRFYHEAKPHHDGLFANEPSPDASPLAVPDLPTGVMRLPTEVNGTDPSTPSVHPWRLLEQRRLDPLSPEDLAPPGYGDAKYGTTENIVAIEDAGIRAYIPLPDFEHRRPFYGRDKFVYDEERDEYRCPRRTAGATVSGQAHGGGRRLPGRRGHLQRLLPQSSLFRQRPRSHHAALGLRHVS
jgi:transposase